MGGIETGPSASALLISRKYRPPRAIMMGQPDSEIAEHQQAVLECGTSTTCAAAKLMVRRENRAEIIQSDHGITG
jgi:hypothetical protein